MRLHTHLLIAGAALAASTPSALAQATFTVMGDGQAFAMSPDASAVVGTDSQGAFLWTQAGGYAPLGEDGAVGVSADGSMVLGNMDDNGLSAAGVWTAGGGWQSLGGLGGVSGTSLSTAYGMSDDGTAVGLGWINAGTAGAFRWTQATGMGPLPQLGPNSSRASAISGIGNVIGGFDEAPTGPRRAAVWEGPTFDETLILVSPSNPDGIGEVTGLSHNGTYALGIEGGAAFIWSAADGVINWGQLPGAGFFDSGWGNGAADDGSIAVGGFRYFPFPVVATVWTPGAGMERLADHLQARGADLTGYELQNATAISADGKTILGYGNDTVTLQSVWFFATLDGSLGTSYCTPALPNSTGLPGVITASGSADVSANDVTLHAEQLPPSQFAYFLASQTQGSFMPPGSSGVLCLDGSIGRYNQPQNVVQGPAGSITIDLTSIPVNPPQAVLPGDTWSFQCWYRDVANTNNFTDAVGITFL